MNKYLNNLPWHFAERRGGRKPPVPPFFQHSGCLRYSQITPTERVNLTKNLGKRSMELHDANKVYTLLEFKVNKFIGMQTYYLDLGKFFIMSTEFNKNISDWRHYCTDYKNDLDFFLRLAKWPKIAVKKSQIFQKF